MRAHRWTDNPYGSEKCEYIWFNLFSLSFSFLFVFIFKETHAKHFCSSIVLLQESRIVFFFLNFELDIFILDEFPCCLLILVFVMDYAFSSYQIVFVGFFLFIEEKMKESISKFRCITEMSKTLTHKHLLDWHFDFKLFSYIFYFVILLMENKDTQKTVLLQKMSDAFFVFHFLSFFYWVSAIFHIDFLPRLI